MKTLLSILSFCLVSSVAVGDTLFRKPEIMAKDYGPQTSGTLNKILTDLGSNPGTVVVSGGKWSMTNNLVFPTTMSLVIVPGSTLDIISGVSIGINSELLAGDYLLFTGLGTATGTVKCLYRFTSWGSRTQYNIGDGSHAVTLEQHPNADTNSLDDITEALAGAGITIVRTNGTITISQISTNLTVLETNALIEIGMIMPFIGSTTPSASWLFCNGALVSTNTFSNLFAEIGFAHGGSGANFAVPDMRGLFLRGQNSSRTGAFSDPDRTTRTSPANGAIVGDKIGSLQQNELFNHTHTIDVRDFAGNSFVPGGSLPGAQLKKALSDITGGNESRPKNMSVRWFIRAL
ncbi:MAG: tail fiber protein [Bacteroidetes bacterium]|nr:tail fiber protein [Bacteroidota bacterium]